MTIGKAFSYRCLSAREKGELPLLIAALAIRNGRITRNQGVPRPRADRKSNLMRDTEIQIQNHYGETASEILCRQEGGGVVAHSDADSVTYWLLPGEQRKITRKRYENIFSAAKKSVDATRSSGRRSKKPSTG